MLEIVQKIQDFIKEEYLRVGFTNSSDYIPTLGFKISNNDSKTSESFKVKSLEQAEQIVTYFISSAQTGEIFTNDIFQEDKDLFLRVKVILPTN